MPSVTVVDTSCLILLNKIGQLKLLENLFAEVTITQTVANEFQKPLPDWIRIAKVNSSEIKGLSINRIPRRSASGPKKWSFRTWFGI